MVGISATASENMIFSSCIQYVAQLIEQIDSFSKAYNKDVFRTQRMRWTILTVRKVGMKFTWCRNMLSACQIFLMYLDAFWIYKMSTISLCPVQCVDTHTHMNTHIQHIQVYWYMPFKFSFIPTLLQLVEKYACVMLTKDHAAYSRVLNFICLK